jgi:hypothetical protein
VRRMRILYSPHPQPLSHRVAAGCRGERRCALLRVPPLPPVAAECRGARRFARSRVPPRPPVAAECRGARRFALPLFSSLARLPNGACVGKNCLCPNNPTLDRCALTLNRSARGVSLNSRVAHLILNPRKIPLNFPRIAPSPLDIRAKMCYTIDVIGATPE